jgi:hypothetical protein
LLVLVDECHGCGGNNAPAPNAPKSCTWHQCNQAAIE